VPKTDETMLKRARQMRHEPSPVETKLWSNLRNKQLNGTKFAHQVVIGPYIADFVARSHKLVIELDGDSHGNRAEYDARRTAFLERRGYRVIRFANSEVVGNLEGVLEAILAAIGSAPLPGPLPEGEREK
jgi:very-short-patch-repair endonuclease